MEDGALRILDQIWLIWLFSIFVAIIAWAMWPRNKEKFERYGRIPFEGDDRHGE